MTVHYGGMLHYVLQNGFIVPPTMLSGVEGENVLLIAPGAEYGWMLAFVSGWILAGNPTRGHRLTRHSKCAIGGVKGPHRGATQVPSALVNYMFMEVGFPDFQGLSTDYQALRKPLLRVDMQFKQFVILATAFAPMAALLAGAVPVDVKRRDTPTFTYGYDPESGSTVARRQFTYGYDPESGSDVERRDTPTFDYGYNPESGNSVERRQFTYGYDPESGSEVERRDTPAFNYGYKPESGNTVERRQFTYGYDPESGNTVARRQFTYGYNPESGSTTERRDTPTFDYGYGHESAGENTPTPGTDTAAAAASAAVATPSAAVAVPSAAV
ncbi:hypothetical protein EVJ58_g5691 [Rhodofomes roseus]|uniref:Uncharacterized protein n=1 Tax=Rhodofomes roseus TaxID=34475 RepID=A0A4Y9YC41_9APHY|nr:hypothetical protein EVJ58_g5691 [Rhodofomes roseus]